MRYPNLVWAAAHRRKPHYQLALDIGISESRFSRCLRGRNEFSLLERTKIAQALGFSETWLFAEALPPPSNVESHAKTRNESDSSRS